MRLLIDWSKLKQAMAGKRNRENNAESKKHETTEYLLSSKVNRERLLRATADLENEKKNVVERALIEE